MFDVAMDQDADYGPLEESNVTNHQDAEATEDSRNQTIAQFKTKTAILWKQTFCSVPRESSI